MAVLPRRKRDPIKKTPLHDPGESLRHQINELIEDKVMLWFWYAAIGFGLTFLEWWRWYFQLPNHPVVFTVIFVLFLPIAIWRVVRLLREVERLQLGLKGERRIGQFLQDELIPKGYQVVHDICDDNFNIDHVVIGPAGVFAVETKTNSKPEGDSRVDYDGQEVLVDGQRPDRDPVKQARSCAARLTEILLEYSGAKVTVRPVVLYPGWYVNEPQGNVATWVLNETRFLGYVGQEEKRLAENRLDEEQVRKLSFALHRYVRDRDSQATKGK